MFAQMNETATMEMPAMATLEGELSIPYDLSEWVPVAELRQWIMTEVAQLDWTSAEILELLRQHPHFEPKALLNTMTLAYATGIFTAEEIARRCSTDIEFRAVRPKLPPVSTEMIAFRKENRGVLKWTLAQAITRAVKSQFVEGDAIETLPAGLRRAVIENAVERLDLARHLDRKGSEL